MKKIISIGICIITFLCIFTPHTVKANTDTRIVDFGKVGHLSAEYYFTEFGMKVGGEFDLSGGINWPIEVRMISPDSIKPGQMINVTISTSGGLGEIWYQFYGHAEATVAGYTLYEKTINFPHTTILSMTVPIGQNIVSPASSGQITVATWQKTVDLYLTQYDISADLRFAFDFEITSSSYVTGDIQCSGNALKNSVTESYTWGSSYQKSLQISSSAKTGDSLGISVSNMKYILQNIRIKVTNFYVYAGYYTDIPLVGSDANAITGEIPISELIPQYSTRADYLDNGEFVDTSEVISVPTLQNSLTIPSGYEPSGPEINPFYILAIVLIVVPIVIIAWAVTRKSKKQYPNVPMYNPPPPPGSYPPPPNYPPPPDYPPPPTY